jgi:TorA maturation chaperone TorD
MQQQNPSLTASEIADIAQWFVAALDYPYRLQARNDARAGGGSDSAPVLTDTPPALSRWLTDADALLAQRDGVTYCGLFDIGNPEPPVPLLESHYHRDPLARLRRVVNFYRAYGVVQGEQHAPDHLCVELSYLAYLARIAAMYPLRADLLSAVRAFAHAHPGSYVGKCCDGLAKQADSGPYLALFNALAQFLAQVGGETRIAIAGEAAA